MLNFFRTSSSSDERNTAMRSLGRARDPELIKQTLALTLSGEVKNQDLYLPVSGLRSHAEGIDALFTWLQEQWGELHSRLSGNPGMLSTMVTICTAGFTKPEQLEKVKAFFKSVDTKAFDQSLAQSKDSVRSKISWIERDAEDVAAWVKDNGYKANL